MYLNFDFEAKKSCYFSRYLWKSNLFWWCEAYLYLAYTPYKKEWFEPKHKPGLQIQSGRGANINRLAVTFMVFDPLLQQYKREKATVRANMNKICQQKSQAQHERCVYAPGSSYFHFVLTLQGINLINCEPQFFEPTEKVGLLAMFFTFKHKSLCHQDKLQTGKNSHEL